MKDFEYNGIRLRYIEKHDIKCDDCYFWEENISCISKKIPECKNGIFIKVD